MIYYFIALGVILICAVIIGVVISKKFSKLSALDLEAMKHHKQAQVKVSIVEERLERNLKEFRNKLAIKTAPWRKKIKELAHKIYHRAINLHKKYQEQENANKPLKQQDKEAIRQKNGALCTAAEELIKQEQYSDAEKKYIEAISLDQQNIDTYKGLSDLYIIKKDYKLALETLEFVKQINPDDDVVWRQLGTVCDNLENNEKAIKCYKKAVDLVPNNPKNLDLLIQMTIKGKDRYLAQSTLNKLAEVNPDNQKLQEYKEQIENL